MKEDLRSMAHVEALSDEGLDEYIIEVAERLAELERHENCETLPAIRWQRIFLGKCQRIRLRRQGIDTSKFPSGGY